MFAPTHIIAHRDADGLIGGILLEKCFPDAKVQYVGYNKLEATVDVAMKADSSVIITDISLTEELYEKHRRKFEIGEAVLIDHHSSTTPLINEHGVVFDEEYAGSTLTFKWLLEKYPEFLSIIRPYADIAKCTEDYDLWRHEDWRSVYWTALIKVYGFDNIRNRFKNNPSADFTLAELRMVKIISNQREETRKYIEENISIFNSKSSTHNIAVFEEPDSITCMFEELSAYTKTNKIDLTLILYKNMRRCSLRSNGIDILNTEWNKLFRGHPNACGLKPEHSISEVLDMLSDLYIINK